jgi:hypothetical protein
MAPVGAEVVQRVAAASAIAATYAVDQDPESAKELLAAASTTEETPVPSAMDEVSDPEAPAERKMRPTRAPERGVDWGDVATEGSRVVRSGTFNTILKAILSVFGGGRRR